MLEAVRTISILFPVYLKTGKQFTARLRPPLAAVSARVRIVENEETRCCAVPPGASSGGPARMSVPHVPAHRGRAAAPLPALFAALLALVAACAPAVRGATAAADAGGPNDIFIGTAPQSADIVAMGNEVVLAPATAGAAAGATQVGGSAANSLFVPADKFQLSLFTATAGAAADLPAGQRHRLARVSLASDEPAVVTAEAEVALPGAGGSWGGSGDGFGLRLAGVGFCEGLF